MSENKRQPPTPKEAGALFMASIGYMRREDDKAMAEGIADLMLLASRNKNPAQAAERMAGAIHEWAVMASAFPAQAQQLARMAATRSNSVAQGSLSIDKPPEPQPQRRAAAPKPRGP